MKTLKILALSLLVSLFAFACTEEEEVKPIEPAVFPASGPTETPSGIY